MSELSLNDRLKHFERNQLSVGDKYGAEVLYRARMRIDALVRYVRAVRDYKNPEIAWEELPKELRKEIENAK